MEKIKTVILCGGKSSRMGTDKALLSIDGKTFLEHLVEEFGGEATGGEREEVILSVGDRRRYEGLIKSSNIRFVEDRYRNCGPLGGLQAVCRELHSGADGFWITTVDLPLADRLLREELASFFGRGIEAVIPIEEDGRLHPLCAVYRTAVVDRIERQLQEGNYRVQSLLRELRVCYVPVEKLTCGSRKLRNVNTPEDYRDLCNMNTAEASQVLCNVNTWITKNKWGIPIISLASYSGSGKTTFLEGLIAEFTRHGIRTAVLKHDVHGFAIDREGKDTFRFAKAGADPVLICADTQAARMDYHKVPETELLDGIYGVDLILIEGFKHGKFPKILLFREATGQPVAMDFSKEQPILVVSDRMEWPEATCPVMTLEDVAGAADFLIHRYDLEKDTAHHGSSMHARAQ